MQVPEPMNARSEDSRRNIETLSPEDWYMEKKLDGYRLIVVSDYEEPGAPLDGFSRAGRSQLLKERLPHIWEELDELSPVKYTVLDGELSTEDDDFAHVAGVMKSLPEKALKKQEDAGKPLLLVLFDVLFWNGKDLRRLPQEERRQLLEAELAKGAPAQYLRLAGKFAPDRELVLNWQALGGEGAILKNKRAPYLSGKRPTDTWLKIKAVEDADVVVMGFTEANEGKTGKFKGLIGAVVFGQYKKCDMTNCDGQGVYRQGPMMEEFTCDNCNGAGRVLVKRGQTSGMDDATRRHMTENPGAYLGHVMVVKHMGKQRDGFRHPQFLHMRDDKNPEDCTWD